jgi:hypothetical protein
MVQPDTGPLLSITFITLFNGSSTTRVQSFLLQVLPEIGVLPIPVEASGPSVKPGIVSFRAAGFRGHFGMECQQVFVHVVIERYLPSPMLSQLLMCPIFVRTLKRQDSFVKWPVRFNSFQSTETCLLQPFSTRRSGGGGEP